MINKIQGIRKVLENGIDLWVDGVQLNINDSLKLRNHSPTGFNAGYGGSGPAQSALAILLHVVGKEKAQRCYQTFKWDFISKPEYFDNDFEIEIDVKEWVEKFFNALNA